MEIIVPDDQLSLAIGRRPNVRLASQQRVGGSIFTGVANQEIQRAWASLSKVQIAEFDSDALQPRHSPAEDMSKMDIEFSVQFPVSSKTT